MFARLFFSVISNFSKVSISLYLLIIVFIVCNGKTFYLNFFRFYALAAAAAILKYAEFEQNIIFSMKSIRVNYESGDNITFIGKT